MPSCPVCKFSARKTCLLHEPDGSACQKRMRRLLRGSVSAADDLEYRRMQRRRSRGADETVDRLTSFSNSKKALVMHRLNMHKANHQITPKGNRLGLYFARQIEDYYDEPIIKAVSQYSQILRKLTPQDLVLDIGSNVGVFSVEAALRGSRVKAFEPCHDHVVIARQHSVLNNVTKLVHTYEAAVVGRCKNNNVNHVKLYLCNGRNNGSHTILHTKGRLAKFVPCLPAHKAFRFKFTAAKVDCEGAEYEFLDELLRKCNHLRLLVVELHLKTKQCHEKAVSFVNTMKTLPGWRTLNAPNLKPSNWATVGCWERKSAQRG
jgi:FkbM family methyltransferase